MDAAIRWPLFFVALASASGPALASTRVAIYAIVDHIELEPSNLEPERAWISGTFVIPTAVSSGLHEPPARGSLYFSVNPGDPGATRRDWEALRAAAGTGNPVGFGQYWMSCSRSGAPGFPHATAPSEANCSFEATVQSDRTRATPEPYPIPSSEGVVTAFDQGDDLCPRFGRPSVEIIADLRETHSPGSVHDDAPVCDAWVGLIRSSDLASVFRIQIRDDTWADAMESLLLSRIADAPGLELAALRVACRETICWIHLAFPTAEYQEAEGNELAANAVWGLPQFAEGGKIVAPRGIPTMDYYIQRRRPD